MRKSKLICAALLFFTLFCTSIQAATLNDTQIIKSDHWVYDAIYSLYTKSGKTCPGNTFPITVGELKFLLKQIDASELDSSTANIYKKTYDFLYESSDLGKKTWDYLDSLQKGKNSNNSQTSQNSNMKNDFLKLGAEIQLTPEAYLKTNKDISWYTFRADPYFKDNFATLPILIGFEDLITMETDFYYGKNLDAARSEKNWFNFPLKATDSDFLLPKFAYGSTGFFKENWGLTFHIATTGHTIGKTQTGSIIYNRTFETTAYTELNLYSNIFSYALDVSQVDYNRFLYLHHVEIRPFDNLKFSIIEGGMAVSHFEIRYLNPFMLIHSFRPADEYKQTVLPDKYRAELKYCAYLGLSAEFVPCKNLRTYFLLAQDEIQTSTELESFYGKLLPNALGFQAGAELFISGSNNRMWKINLESVYTMPFLYIKHSPESSLFRQRKKVTEYSGGVINSWIGTPFGPDCLAFQTGVTCRNAGSWSASLSYIFTMHGEKGFDTFTDPRWKFVDPDTGKTYYAYYPAVKSEAISQGVLNTTLTTDDCIAEARNSWLSGTLEYRNDLALNGSYILNDYCSFDAQFVYTFIFNNSHRLGEFQQGVELSISATFKYF